MKSVTDFFRRNYAELNENERARIERVKIHAQAIVDIVTGANADLSGEGSYKVCEGITHLETAVMWLVKGLTAKRNREAA